MQIDVEHIIIGIVAFLLGFLLGRLSNALLNKLDYKNSGYIVLIVVTLVWTISVVVDIMDPTYETSPFIHGLMGAIVGYYYKNKNGEASSKS